MDPYKKFPNGGLWSGSLAVRLTAVVLFAILLLTNRYASTGPDAELIRRCCTDSYDYNNIANAFPHLPPKTDRPIAFRYAQRFFIPWLAGGLANLQGSSIDVGFRCLSIALALATILMTCVLLREERAGNVTQIGLLTLFVFNAYAFRFDLAFPWYVADLGFELGLVTVLFGVMRGKAAALVGGVILASLSRQTGLLLLPSLVLWLIYQHHTFNRRASRTLAIVCPLIAVGIYEGTALIAGTFAAASTNAEHLTGLFTWIDHDFSLTTFTAFLARLTLPLLPLFLLGVALTLHRRTMLRTDTRFWLLVSITAAIGIQPALAGPGLTEGNGQRLVALGLVPLLLAFARLMAVNGLELPSSREFWLVFAAGAFFSSLHHVDSFIAQNDSELASSFGTIFLVASLMMAAAAAQGWRSVDSFWTE